MRLRGDHRSLGPNLLNLHGRGGSDHRTAVRRVRANDCRHHTGVRGHQISQLLYGWHQYVLDDGQERLEHVEEHRPHADTDRRRRLTERGDDLSNRRRQLDEDFLDGAEDPADLSTPVGYLFTSTFEFAKQRDVEVEGSRHLFTDIAGPNELKEPDDAIANSEQFVDYWRILVDVEGLRDLALEVAFDEDALDELEPVADLLRPHLHAGGWHADTAAAPT
ncbi:hypothetical protein GTA07_10505 [Rhodococcus hoagii]|nr:hypothetical protein [Prescottella equi]